MEHTTNNKIQNRAEKQETRKNSHLVSRISHLSLRASRGLTSLELIVVLGIFATLMGVTMFNYSDFQSRITLENTVQEIALRLQSAQNNAISGLYPKLVNTQQDPPSPGVWKPAYGVYFSLTAPSSFAYFYDQNSENSDSAGVDRDGLMYGIGLADPDSSLGDPPLVSCGLGNSECLDVIKISSGERIIAICNDDELENNNCSAHDNVSISFNRPFPEACIIVDDPSFNCVSVENQAGQPNNRVTLLVLGRGTSGVRGVVVTRLGQIFNINVPAPVIQSMSFSPAILAQSEIMDLLGVYNAGNGNGSQQQQNQNQQGG